MRGAKAALLGLAVALLASGLGACSVGLGFGNAPDAPNNCPIGASRCN
jgi:hypothetical protein